MSTRGVGTRAKASANPGRDGLRAAVTGVVVGLLLGPVVGILWLWIAPAPTAINAEGLIYLKDQNTSEFIAADGWFLIISLVVGAITGGFAFRLLRRWPMFTVVGLTLGALGGAWIAWKVGINLGPEPLEKTASDVPEGGTISAPISIRAKGVLLGWPVGALIAFVSLYAGLDKEAGHGPLRPTGVPEPAPDPDAPPAPAAAEVGSTPVPHRRAPIRPISRPGQAQPLGQDATGPSANGPSSNGRGPSVGADGRPGELGTGQGR